jgi:hypothetical protein
MSRQLHILVSTGEDRTRGSGESREICSLFAWLISHQPAVLFSQNKPAISNQPAVLFSQNKPALAISHQPTEQADDPKRNSSKKKRITLILENWGISQIWSLLSNTQGSVYMG